MKLVDRRTGIGRIARGQPHQGAAQSGSALGELLLEPGAESAFVDTRGLLVGELFESRIDDRFHGPLAQNLRAEGMDGADGGFFQMFQRVFDICALVRR